MEHAGILAPLLYTEQRANQDIFSDLLGIFGYLHGKKVAGNEETQGCNNVHGLHMLFQLWDLATASWQCGKSALYYHEVEQPCQRAVVSDTFSPTSHHKTQTFQPDHTMWTVKNQTSDGNSNLLGHISFGGLITASSPWLVLFIRFIFVWIKSYSA